MKKSIVTLIAAALAPTAATLAAFPSPASALSDDQLGRISQYCGTIRQTLQTIQREDSRTRVRIGAIYETISSNYLTPLNLRLVTNNIASPTLVQLQADFASTRSDFSAKFIEYSRSFDDLLATDCRNNPTEFYNKLTTTRALRAELHTLTVSLSDRAHRADSSVTELRSGL